MKRLSLVFGTTNSLPVGTPSQEFERTYQRIYKPFLRVLYNMPDVPLTLHYSGTLLSWLDSAHSEFTDVLGEMVQRKQVELLGGGFWDPVFSLIPRPDCLGQIEGLTTFIRKRFGRRPRGAWVTEHVWEPFLASTLKNSGMEYIFLDDHHFRVAGIPSDEIVYPRLTEDQGKVIVVFPVRRSLEATIGKTDPESVIRTLEGIASENGSPVVSMVFDGRRYANGSETGHADYDDRWLERFLTLALANSEWLELTTPGRYLRRVQPRRRAYFPSTSHDEMMLWTLDPERQRRLLEIREKLNGSRDHDGYLAGGFFRDFLTRYPESNMMYAKMQYTHVLVNQIRGDKYRKQAAREELWKGQSHTAYWHGRAGGIYHNHLRKAVYSALIEAEKVTREKGIFIPSIVSVDYDMDGVEEYLYQGLELNAYVHREGGRIVELDYLPVPWNYLDVMSRHRELYHEQGSAPTIRDKYSRRAFVDHFFSDEVDIHSFNSMDFSDPAELWSTLFEVSDYNRSGNLLSLSANANLGDADHPLQILITKSYRFNGSSVELTVTIRNAGDQPVSTWYGCEVNLGFVSRHVDSLRVHVFADTDTAVARKTMARRSRTGSDADNASHTEIGPELQVLDDAGSVIFEDLKNRLDVSLSLSRSTEIWSLPIVTQSMHDGYLEEVYQGSSVIPRWPVHLEPRAETSYTLKLRIDQP